MKQSLLFLSLFLLLVGAFRAQTTDVISGLGGPYDVLLNGNDLYVAEFDSNRVSRIDVSSVIPARVDVVTGISGADGIFLNGNDLYVASYNSNLIIKVDISLPFPAPIDTVVNFINGPAGMILRGNDLYIAEYNAAQIVRIDITDPLPITSIDTIASGTSSGGFPNVNSLEIDGDFLYFSEDFFGADQISRIDLTQPIPITPQLVVPPANVNGPRGIITIGTDLYIAEASSGDISKIDLTGSIPTIPTLVSNTIVAPVFSGPADIVFNGTNLYIAEQSSGKITLIRLAPDEPTLVASADTICEGEVTTINISSNDTLNAGANWFLYANDLTGTPVDSSLTGNFIVTGFATTSFIVRGEGNGLTGQPDTLIITVNALPNLNITQGGDTLFATFGNYSYQWIDCNFDTTIARATDSIYFATVSGNYSVIVTDLVTSCFDTSACVSVVITGISELEEVIDFVVYPNPSNGQFTIEVADNETVILEVLNNVGQIVLSERQVTKKENINLTSSESGLYLIKLTNKKGETVYKKILIN